MGIDYLIIQLQIAERHKELERLKVELASLKAVEAQQQEYLAMCKKLWSSELIERAQSLTGELIGNR